MAPELRYHQALRRKDLAAVLDASRACSEADDLAGFADAVVAQIPGLVGCDICSYNEIDQVAGTGFGRTNPADMFGTDGRRLSESFDVLTAYGDEHPLIPRALASPQDFPLSWSDLLTTAEVHRTNLYQLLFRQVATEDQLAAVLHASPGFVVGITVDRTRRGFSERDRALLELFARQLAGVRRLVIENERLRRTAASAPMEFDDGADWELKLLGGFALTGPLGPVHLEGKPAELVKILALADGPVVLDQLLEQLWPETDFDVARRRLRVVLHRVPHTPSPLVVRRGDSLCLGPSVRVDTGVFVKGATSALAAGRRAESGVAALGEQALSLYGADLLPEDLYLDWAAAPRERLRRLRLDLMDAVAAAAERAGDPAGAARLLAEAVDADPLDEARQLRLGWLYASTGRRPAALALCARARRTAAELGLGLSPGWKALLQALQTDRAEGGETLV